MNRLIYLTAPGYEHLRPLGREAWRYDFDRYPDGEISIKLLPDRLTSSDVVIFGGCHDAAASEALLALAYEVARRDPASLTVVNTYFRNARSDRSVRGEAVMAKFQASMWSGLGQVYPGVKLVFIDLHNDNILNYFHGAVRTSNVSFEVWQALLGAVKGRLGSDVSLATVDGGRADEIRKLANLHGYGFADIVKQRLSGSETRVLEVHGDVNGRTVVIFDDMISTGNSLVNAARAYLERGADRVFACATHGVFVNVSAMQETDPFANIGQVFVTDSHPNALMAGTGLSRKVTVVPLNTVPGFG